MSQALYVRTDTVPIGDLSPYPGNAKQGDTAAILASLRRNAQYRAVVAREMPDKSLVVLAGNNTLAAMEEHGPGDCGVTIKRRGRKAFPCGVCGNSADYTPALRVEVVSCDDDTARRANLADNKTAELGTWDNAALADLIASLDDDLDGTAYSGEDYDDLLKVTGALAESSTAFLADFADGLNPSPAAPAGTPSLHPFSESSPPPATAGTAPVAAPELEELPPTAPGAVETRPPMSPGVHTGPEAYTGPGARSSPGQGIAIPPPVTTVPLQWVFTVPQRDTVRAAIKQATTAGGHDTAAAALTAVCAAYLTPVSEAP